MAQVNIYVWTANGKLDIGLNVSPVLDSCYSRSSFQACQLGPCLLHQIDCYSCLNSNQCINTFPSTEKKPLGSCMRSYRHSNHRWFLTAVTLCKFGFVRPLLSTAWVEKVRREGGWRVEREDFFPPLSEHVLYFLFPWQMILLSF